MCQPKYWNKIFTKEVESPTTRDVVLLQVIAERSDLELFNIIIEIFGVEEHLTIANKFKRALDALESYRDCDCSIQAGQCVKHFTNISLEKLGIGSEQARVSLGGT